MGAGSILFGFAAGMLSTLSPCVLPLLPLVLGAAASAHRFGAAMLAAGMVTSFVGVGLFIALLGFGVGIDGDLARTVAAVLLALVGLVLLSGALQQRFAVATSGLADAGNRLIARFGRGLWAQFAIGALLGAVWSPCVGPTLGAAWALAAQGRDIGMVAVVMVAFGIGAALPLMLVAGLSREAMQRWRGRMMSAGAGGKYLLGGAALAVSAFILSGADHWLEALAVAEMPDWLIELTTRF